MLESSVLSTPIGLFEVAGSLLGVSSVKRVDNHLDTPGDGLHADHPVVECCHQIKAYFEGKRTVFNLKIDLSGASDFHQRVWLELLKIPFGKTASYADIAERIGNPRAVRAVGMANRKNPIAIVIPCHRVIGKSGELRGYFYGIDIKYQLLQHENPVRFAEQGALFGK